MDRCNVACQAELLNAATLFPPIAILMAVPWAVAHRTLRQSSGVRCILAGCMFELPFAFTNHVYCAFRGWHDRRLLQLDQLGISVLIICVSWALAKSKTFTGLMVLLIAPVDVVMFFGPYHLQDDVTWRMICFAVLNYVALSPMVWSRDECDPNLLPTVLLVVPGVALAVLEPLGAYSHPLFHLLLIPYVYLIARSAVANELQLEADSCADLTEDGESDDGTTEGEELLGLDADGGDPVKGGREPTHAFTLSLAAGG
mmetsp:Transcript_88146/g.278806  ORF Transcript_88146/g.278806 Transcript_88146/m.278806 type:complete len:257 (-) Transcript_88146:108-878(-)